MFEAKEQQIISGSKCFCKGYMRFEIKEPHSKVEAIVYVNVTWDVWNERTTIIIGSNCLCKWYMTCLKRKNHNHKWKQMFM
jgi:hypothetical protein